MHWKHRFGKILILNQEKWSNSDMFSRCRVVEQYCVHRLTLMANFSRKKVISGMPQIHMLFYIKYNSFLKSFFLRHKFMCKGQVRR